MANGSLKERIIELCTKPVKTSCYVFLTFTSFVVLITLIFYNYDKPFFENIVVEAHGMLFDILVIGIFIFALQKIGEKKLEKERNIQRWQEEINDYKGWDEKEAMHRITGNIKRLNRNNVTDINLAHCYLKNSKLLGVCLQRANLYRTNFVNAQLIEADFQDAELIHIQLNGALLHWANFTNADLYRAILAGAILIKAILHNTNLEGAQLNNVNFMQADLMNANLKKANLQNARYLTVEQLSSVETLYQAKLDPELEKEIKEKYPHLLEPPKKEKEQEKAE